jgi:beta-phosphoglucomutase-like phosphatase (HAD superfamily)
LDIDWDHAIRQASAVAGYNVKSLLAFYEKTHDSPIFQRVSEEIEKLELVALKNATVNPFISEFLRTISENRIEIYLVTMQSEKVVEKFLRETNLKGYFNEIITRERYPSKKEQIKYIVEKPKINPSEILLIDDSIRNINSCRDLKIACFHFLRKQDLKKLEETFVAIAKMVKSQPA